MPWSRRRVLASAAGICVISGCLGLSSSTDRSLPKTPSGTWTQSGTDFQNTCVANVSVPDRGTYAWSGGSGVITPLVVDETVYTVDDKLTALNARTGEDRWKTDLAVAESPNSATQPAVAGDRILLASESRLAAFDTADGSERWERSITGLPGGPVTVAADHQLGFVFLSRPDRSESPPALVAFRTDSGNTAWSAPLRDTSSAPAVFGDHVYAAGWAGPEMQVLRCLRMNNGELAWERELEDPNTPPVVTETGVFVGEGDGIIVYDRADGERLASIDVPQGPIRAIAIDDGMAFVLGDSGLSAITVPDGGEEWSLSGGDSYAAADGLAVGRETVVAAVFHEPLGTGPSIAAFDKADGTDQWVYSVSDAWSPTVDTPVIADGAVFVMTNAETGVTALGDLPPQE